MAAGGMAPPTWATTTARPLPPPPPPDLACPWVPTSGELLAIELDQTLGPGGPISHCVAAIVSSRCRATLYTLYRLHSSDQPAAIARLANDLAAFADRLNP